MLTFDIITIFPRIFDSYFAESIIKRAQRKKFIKINIRNLRDFTADVHKTVDDKPYGGGPGMILKVEPILKATAKFKKIAVKKPGKKRAKVSSKIILLSAKGKKFDQKMARKFSKLSQIILITGHYEGVDERVAKYVADEEVSIGDYVLTGGELPAMVIVDASTRLIPGVIKEESLKEESFKDSSFLSCRQADRSQASLLLEYPQYTRPEIFEPAKALKAAKKNQLFLQALRAPKTWRVPKILLSGNHKKIEEWRQEHSKIVEK